MFVLALLIVAAASAAIASGATLGLDHAEFVAGDSPAPPPDSAPWRAQRLPDDWIVSRPGASGYGWYRLRFVLAARPGALYAVYLPLVKSAGEVFVNGVHVGQTGPLGAEAGGAAVAARTPPLVIGRGLFAHTPWLFAIRPELLHAGANTVDVHLWVKPGAAGALSRATVGPEASVRAIYDREAFLIVTGPQMIAVFSVGYGVFILFLWLRRRHESMYGYFGLTALAFALFVAGRFVIIAPPIPFPYWGVLVWLGLEAYIVLMCLFALRYGGWRWPRVEAFLWGYLAVSPLVDYASFVGVGGWIAAHWWLMTFVVTVLYVGIFWSIAWQRRTLETLGLAIAGSIKLVISANERLLPFPIDQPRYQPFAYLPMFIMIGWVLIDRFVKSLNRTEELNAELERRVAEKHSELERNYQRMQSMARQQAIADERARIMSDMHDGIGGQLISTLSLVEHGELSAAEVAEALRECLDDLRLTVDSLEPTDNDLLPVMGNLRYRLDGRLRKRGIELDWRVAEVPRLACLTPQNVLHVLRILQEAFTNVVKHAQATRVRVETGVDAARSHVFIRVCDNGIGFDGARTGHGLASMKRRAELVGGELDVTPSATGTTLSLLLPAE